MSKLGKMEKIDDLRSIWAHEARDFSKWLSQEENLALLSETVGIDIVLSELESSVGGFSVDLFATEEGTERKIIIENQLEDTNHDHLGKIITYASGKGAEVIIWIVKRARDEHKQAIEWLNQHTDENIGFFLLEIELWKIDDSFPAPKFNVIERPNDWAKTMKAVENLSETKKLQFEFWQAFTEYAFSKDKFQRVFSKRKVYPRHWYDLSVGNSSCCIRLTANTQKKRLGAEIYIHDDKELFEKFKEKKSEIEQKIGQNIEWRVAAKDCRILALSDGDISKGESSWTEYFAWYCECVFKFRDIVEKYCL